MDGPSTINGVKPEETATVGASPVGDDKPALTSTKATEANADLVEHMKSVLKNSLRAVVELRLMLKRTYWIVIGLSTVMFAVGMALISSPLWAPWLNALFPNAASDMRLPISLRRSGLAWRT